MNLHCQPTCAHCGQPLLPVHTDSRGRRQRLFRLHKLILGEEDGTPMLWGRCTRCSSLQSVPVAMLLTIRVNI